MSMLEELLHGPSVTVDDSAVTETPDLVCAELQRLGIHSALQQIMKAPYYARLTDMRKAHRLRQALKTPRVEAQA